jgi:hypothetical protein
MREFSDLKYRRISSNRDMCFGCAFLKKRVINLAESLVEIGRDEIISQEKRNCKKHIQNL